MFNRKYIFKGSFSIAMLVVVHPTYPRPPSAQTASQAWAAGLCGLAGPLHGLANQA